MGHLAMDTSKMEETLKAFQKQMGYTDEELAHILDQPKFVKTLTTMPTPKVRNSTLVLEVVESHGCSEGMKVGDKIYFTGLALLDPKRSDPWCAYALNNVTAVVYACHNMILNGLDPNLLYTNHFQCFDCGSKFGLGQVVVRATVIKEDIMPDPEAE